MTAMTVGEQPDDRFILLSRWVDEHTPAPVRSIAPASEDASFRRYFRVQLDDATLIAMDAPPPAENLGVWLEIAAKLTRAGIAAPGVLAADPAAGLALIDDLGTRTYLNGLDEGADPDRLYGDAIHTLIAMQSGVDHDGLPPYDEALLRQEMGLFTEWLLEHHLGLKLEGSDATAWRDTTDWLVSRALAQPRVFVHRDYHSRNLMLGDPGAPGVIDFQDAMSGPASYDLVSLLKDCYISWPEKRIAAWRAQYLDLARQTPLARVLPEDDDAFARDFDAMGVQRHLKASGIFARLMHRDGKAGYLDDVPRTLGHIMSCEDQDGKLAWLHELIRERVLPALARAAD